MSGRGNIRRGEGGEERLGGPLWSPAVPARVILWISRADASVGRISDTRTPQRRYAYGNPHPRSR